MINLGLSGFVAALFALGLRRPFLWVLAYLYVDILVPQKISWGFLSQLPVSLMAFVFAFGGWVMLDDKRDTRFTMRQGLMVLLLVYCGLTTMFADYPEPAAEKWAWVWKALLFAIILPLTLRTRLRFEAAAVFMVLTVGAILISGGIKTLAGGGGYGTLRTLVAENAGIYEGSTLSTIAIATIPLIWWVARYTTIFPKSKLVTLYAAGLTFAAMLIPIGTQTRTGLLCLALLAVLALRSVKRRLLYISLAAVLAVVAIPFLPESYTNRMNTIENHKADQSASTRVAVWMWTLDYVKDHPFGGGFDAYRGNKIKVEMVEVEGTGNNASVDVTEAYDQSRAYHSSYFEMLGEQGWPGLLLWLWLQVLGLWQMERIRHKWKNRTEPGQTWQAPLANALQQAQLVYLAGSVFVGIAFQPFVFMVIGLQCGLWSYLKRVEAPQRAPVRRGAPTLRTKPA
ncbi:MULTISPECIES: putative O-glycosylation ligase, exosortase A system-associated [unclassified Novosphingobium]|uniref:putative O-glycosylation ligase, exosortase A system-associated n=1 Tax=unclassified Novosphingobium TaxID=2644732 RepID=UPI0025EFDDBA|nr:MULTISPECIES: putative O-glycosylation ligase, exosortase A system-associated [unclassified Novosphingobium]HQV04294.1 putative O-glycosylation ligase, exosortase A system-associated [Novosphingobium sp.]